MKIRSNLVPHKILYMKKSILFLFAIVFSCSAWAQSITYSGQIASILDSNCAYCHHQGSLAPFSLESYSDAYTNRIAMESYTQQKLMPPWPPDDTYSTFIHQRSLTDNQINMIKEWVDNGAPEGDPKLTPPAPIFSNGPVLGTPD